MATTSVLLSKVTMSLNASNGGNATKQEVEDHWNYEWNFPFSVILAAVLSISAFLAVVGNSMVLTVVIRHRGMRTRTNLFLVNLAIADLLVGAAVVPFTITTLIEGKWIFGSVTGTFCSINGWLNCFCLVASIHTLMYISVHKHYSITKPLGSHFKLRQILGMMAAAWVWAAVSSTITVTGLSSVRYKQGTTQCGPEYPSGLKSYVFHAIIQVTNVVIPIIILTYCYTRMFRAIRAHSKRLQENSTLEQDIILSQQKKVTITLFIVLAVFVICVLPYHLYTSYVTIKKDKHFSPYFNPVGYMFLYLNSACNPIIYAFRSPSFREGYKEILCQTPHYVISDDTVADELHSPLRRRLSSFFGSFHRASTASSIGIKDTHRASCTSINSVGSQGGSPSIMVTSPRSSRKWQKSMAGMIRSSRRSTKQSSVIRQNGDIIIVKGGKIVSIRKQPGWGKGGLQDASPFLQCATATKNGHSTNGHATGASPLTDNNNLVVMSKVSSASKASFSSEGSDNVFDDTLSPPTSPEEISPGSNLEMIDEERRLLSQRSEAEEEDTAFSKKDVRRLSADAAAAENIEEESSPTEVNQERTGVGIIISIDEDNSILNVMPLTPYTRDRITRSDMFLDSDSSRTNPNTSLAPLVDKTKISKSSQVLSSKRSLHRMLSLEHLDPPISLRPFRSTHNVQKASGGGGFFHHGRNAQKPYGGFLHLPIPTTRRWSFGRQAGKTSGEPA